MATRRGSEQRPRWQREVDEAHRLRWERRWEWPLTVIAVAFLVAYAWPILQPDLPRSIRHLFDWFVWVSWLMFIIDYVVRWRLSPDRRQFFRHSLLDLLLIVLPMVRPLRVLRLVTMLTVMNRRVASSVRGRVAIYVGSSTMLVIFCASLAVLDAERRDPASNITGFGEALWWAVSTVTTVGYGDRYPLTFEGRLVAGLLMIGGIALLGVVTASLASWLIDRVREVEEHTRSATRRDVEMLTEAVTELRADLRILLERMPSVGREDALETDDDRDHPEDGQQQRGPLQPGPGPGGRPVAPQ